MAGSSARTTSTGLNLTLETGKQLRGGGTNWL
jgi:hypothetical protein